MRIEYVRSKGVPMLVQCTLAQGHMRELCGLQVDTISGEVLCTDQTLTLNHLKINTPQSHLTAEVRMDYAAFSPHAGGSLSLRSKGRIAMQYIAAAAGNALPHDMCQAFSPLAMKFKACARGHTDAMTVDSLIPVSTTHLKLPTNHTV